MLCQYINGGSIKMYKIGVKRMFSVFNADLELFIPVFHEWIQKNKIPDHIMVDVADYKHIPDGPGIMLIAHEGNFSIDLENGKAGLLYTRKRTLGDDVIDNIQEITSILDYACKLLESNNSLIGKINFNNQYKIISNDRYYFPTDKQSEKKLLDYSQQAFSNANVVLGETYSGSRLNIKIDNK